MDTMEFDGEELYIDLFEENTNKLKSKLKNLRDMIEESEYNNSELLFDNHNTFYLISIDMEWYDNLIRDLMEKAIKHDLINSMKVIYQLFPFMSTKFRIVQYIRISIEETSLDCLGYLLSEYEFNYSDSDCNWRTFLRLAYSEEQYESAEFILLKYGGSKDNRK